MMPHVQLVAKSDGLWLHLTAEGRVAEINLSVTVQRAPVARSVVDDIRRELLSTHLILVPKERP